MNEFDLIKKYFLTLTEGQPEALGLENDAAVFSCDAGEELVITSDNLVAGVHFFADMPADEIAKRALRVNVSDLVAMGAAPYFYQLAITFPDAPEESWVKDFCQGLREDHKALGIFCSGGNTTKAPGPLNIAVTAVGRLPKGTALPRNKAQPGDKLCLLGYIGDAHLGLLTRLGKISTAHDHYFHDAYIPPLPFVEGVSILRQYATAVIDVSDGLLADLGHLCETSQCGAQIDLSAPIFSQQGRSVLEQGLVDIESLLSGGDDYQLLMAVPKGNVSDLIEQSAEKRRLIQVVGEFTSSSDIVGIDEAGQKHRFDKKGWTHF